MFTLQEHRGGPAVIQGNNNLNNIIIMTIDFTKVPVEDIEGKTVYLDITIIPEETESDRKENKIPRSILQNFSNHIYFTARDQGEQDVARKMFSNQVKEYSEEEIRIMRKYVDTFFLALWLREGIYKVLDKKQ